VAALGDRLEPETHDFPFCPYGAGIFKHERSVLDELLREESLSGRQGSSGLIASHRCAPALSTMAELAAAAALTALTDEASLTALGSGKVAVLFGADWDAPSQQLTQLLTEAATKKTYGTVTLATADADQCDALADAFDVEALPTLLLRENNTTVATHEAPSAALVNETLQEFAKRESVPTTPSDAEAVAQTRLELRLKQLISGAPGMLFMKGSPDTPRCGFSRQIVELLQQASVPFASFDILSDEEVRQGLKKFSDWPTYPQFYANGELVGGLDILKEMVAEGNLLTQLDLKAIDDNIIDGQDEEAALNERLKALTSQSKCMLFMKGSPDNERCGFSRTIVALLREHSVTFDSFDILTDNDVRQGLKKYSDWPTYPQLYVDGELVGGLDIVQEMAADGDLPGQLGL